MLGVFVNAIAVFIGSCIGLLCKEGIPEKFTDAIMAGVALCVTYIGISGTLKGENTIVLIFSIVTGAIAGTAMDIDGKLAKLGKMIENRFAAKNPDKEAVSVGASGKSSIAQGFVTASLLFCTGAMTIVGSLTAGLTGDCETLFTKSVLDFISSIMLTVSLGVGVIFSSAYILVFQGAIALMSGLLAPVLSDAAINEIICAGSVMIMGLGFNMLGITKIKVANYMPAIVFVPIILKIAQLFA